MSKTELMGLMEDEDMNIEEKEDQEAEKLQNVENANSKLDNLSLEKDEVEQIETKTKEIAQTLSDDDLVESISKRKKYVSAQADYTIGAVPQFSFQPSETEEFGKYRFLCWNLIGSIILRNEGKFKAIDIEFANQSFHKNLFLNDRYGIEKGVLNLGGACLASRGKEEDLDEYENDSDSENESSHNTHSIMQFIPFHNWRGIKEWKKALPKHENIDCLAMGTNFIAIRTNHNYIRIFTQDGIQKHMFSYPTPIVALAAYENQLSIVSHNGVPILGQQNLNMRTIDVHSFRNVFDVKLPISGYATLKSFGYTAEGQIYSYDSNQILRLFSPFFAMTWIPVLDLGKDESRSTFWLVGVREGEVFGVELKSKLLQPTVAYKTKITTFEFKVPFVFGEEESDEHQEEILEEQFLKGKLEVCQATERLKHWGFLKLKRKKGENEFEMSEGILNEHQIFNKKRDLDKILIQAVRLCCVKDQIQKACSYANMCFLPQSIQICTKLAYQLNKTHIALQLQELFNV